MNGMNALRITTLMVIDFLNKLKKINDAIIVRGELLYKSTHLQLAHISLPSSFVSLKKKKTRVIILSFSALPLGFILVCHEL